MEKLTNLNNKTTGCDAKLLSVCMTARNDAYCGNFLYRLETAINHLAENVTSLKLSDTVEILITDWNSEKRIGDAIKLNSEAVRICRFISVPQILAKQHNPDNREFNTSLSVNVSIRRATAKFLMFMPCDIIFPRTGFKNLMDLLKGEIAVPFESL